MRVKGEKVARRGYFGDIVTSPYIVYGIETEDKTLLKTQNGEHVKTAADVTEANVTAMFHEIAFQTRYETPNTVASNGNGDGATITEIAEDDEGPTLEEIIVDKLKVDESKADEENKDSISSSDADHPLISVDGIKVIFLPLACTKDLVNKQRFKQFFHFAFFSNSLVHLLEPETRGLFANGAELAVESTKFVLDLKKEHHEQYAGKIVGMAEKAGFRRKTTFDPEKDAVARFSFLEE